MMPLRPPKTTSTFTLIALALLATSCMLDSWTGTPLYSGWTSWRGPQQNGTSLETGLPAKVSLEDESLAWTYDLTGRGTPVIAGGRVYTLGYEGEGKELKEVLICLDENTGAKIWEHRVPDFLSDIIYSRFSIGSPTIDPENGNVLWLSTAGLLSCFTRDGELLWQHSLMSEYGRLTFPNGRTGAPLIDGDLAIVHVATSGWGKQGPARDRFFAFDKLTGVSVWSCTPGGPPKDSSFSYPVVTWEGDRRVLYAGLAGGHVVCVDVRSGDPLWKCQLAIGGLSNSPVLYRDRVIAIHGKENLDSSTIGRMVALRRGAEPGDDGKQVVLGKDDELWRNELVAFTSSPVLVDNRVYQTIATGELCCVNADDGSVLWHHKLAPDQIHASPAYGDGKLYVPMNNGSFHVVRPSDEGAEVLASLQLEGACLGAPAIANGRVYVHTTGKLYCFGAGKGETPIAASSEPSAAPGPAPGPATRLQVLPADLVTQQGVPVAFQARALDANGSIATPSVPIEEWRSVPSGLSVSPEGLMTVPADMTPTAAIVEARNGELSGKVRLRIVPKIPFSDDFEDVTLGPSRKDPDARVGKPRSYWVGGAPVKWQVVELDGSKVLARKLDNPLFQRTMTLIGHPDMSSYTMQVDVRTDGNRRIKSDGGVVNQRYLIVLKGNHQELEVRSNDELLKENVRFRWKPKTWYRLKTRVDVDAEGTATVRAKAWQRDGEEPQHWTIEVRHPGGHTHGSPGLFGFTPQSRFSVYLDNISVTPND